MYVENKLGGEIGIAKEARSFHSRPSADRPALHSAGMSLYRKLSHKDILLLSIPRQKWLCCSSPYRALPRIQPDDSGDYFQQYHYSEFEFSTSLRKARYRCQCDSELSVSCHYCRSAVRIARMRAAATNIRLLGCIHVKQSYSHKFK